MDLNRQSKESNKTCVVCHETFEHLADFSAIVRQKDSFNLICNSCVIKERLTEKDIVKIGFVDVVQKVLVRCAFIHELDGEKLDDAKQIPTRCKNFKPHIEKCVGKTPEDKKCPFLGVVIHNINGVDLGWRGDDEKQ